MVLECAAVSRDMVRKGQSEGLDGVLRNFVFIYNRESLKTFCREVALDSIVDRLFWPFVEATFGD